MAEGYAHVNASRIADVASPDHVHDGFACYAQADDAASDEFGPPEEVEVSVDNITTASYSLVRSGHTAAIIRAHAAAIVFHMCTYLRELPGPVQPVLNSCRVCRSQWCAGIARAWCTTSCAP